MIAELLRWNGAPAEPAARRARFENLLIERLGTLCARNRANACIAEAVGALPAAAVRRFVRAPAVAALLLREDDVGAGLAELVLAELVACGAVRAPAEAWTPRGGRLRDAREERLGETEIVLDDTSPFAFPDDTGLAGTLLLSAAERALVRRRLDESLAVLGAASGPVLPFVGTFIETLAIRREPAEPQAFYSSTFSGYVGLVRFANPQLATVDAAQLADAFVHEAIHGLLYAHEATTAPFLRSPDANDLRVSSPWTGLTIRLHSYLHACAVWYGLYWFWRAVARAGSVPAERCAHLRDRAQAGFRARPVSHGLAPFRPLLAAEAADFLLDLEDRMLTV